LQPNIAKLGGTKQKGAVFSAAIRFGTDERYKGTAVTVRDVMGYHQKGGGHLPQRKLFVNPGKKEVDRLAKVAKKIIQQEIK
jgi:hypothetical protein